MTVTDHSHLGEIDPEFAELLKTIKPPPVPANGPSIEWMRALTIERKKNLNKSLAPSPDVTEEDHQIPVRDGSTIAVRVYTPKSPPEEGSPLLVMYHGGGFCLGDLSSEEILCRRFCDMYGMVVVNVEYRLAPEYPFPTGVNDAYDALKWAAVNAASLRANPAQGFIAGGTSAGGNFAAVVSHLARDDKLSPPLTGVYLSIPATVAESVLPEQYRSEYKSHEQMKGGAVLDRKTLEAFMEWYKPDPASPLFSPLLFPTGHSGLPPTYFTICGMDPLRDEGMLYERVLREEFGVVTKMDIYPGLPHGFWGFFPGLSAAKKWLMDVTEGMKWLLEKGKK